MTPKQIEYEIAMAAYRREQMGRKPDETNVERINKYITYGSPMNQLFVIDAVSKLAELVVKDENVVREQMKDGCVNPEAWIAAAKEWLAIFSV